MRNQYVLNALKLNSETTDLHLRTFATIDENEASTTHHKLSGQSTSGGRNSRTTSENSNGKTHEAIRPKASSVEAVIVSTLSNWAISISFCTLLCNPHKMNWPLVSLHKRLAIKMALKPEESQ